MGGYIEAFAKAKCYQLQVALSKLSRGEVSGMKNGKQNWRDFTRGMCTTSNISLEPRVIMIMTLVIQAMSSSFPISLIDDSTCRFKPEMWAKVAEEMGVPWRAAEAMHWQLGEADMARRAGVVPFSLSSTPIDPPWSGTRSTASASPSDGYTYGGIGIGRGQGMGMPITGGPPMLPSVAEMTTGMSPYNTSAYLVSAFMSSAQPRSSPIPTLPAIGYALYPNLPAMSEGKSR